MPHDLRQGVLAVSVNVELARCPVVISVFARIGVIEPYFSAGYFRKPFGTFYRFVPEQLVAPGQRDPVRLKLLCECPFKRPCLRAGQGHLIHDLPYVGYLLKPFPLALAYPLPVGRSRYYVRGVIVNEDVCIRKGFFCKRRVHEPCEVLGLRVAQVSVKMLPALFYYGLVRLRGLLRS